MLLIGLVQVVVPPHAGVEDRVRDGLDHVTVVVCTAKALRRQHIGAHHHHIGEMAEVVAAHLLALLFGVEEGELEFLVPGDVGVAQEGARIPVRIGGARGVKGAGWEAVQHGCQIVVLLPLGVRNPVLYQKSQKVQQVAGQVPVVPRHDEPPQGVVLQDLLCLPVQHIPVDRLGDQPGVFL